MANLLNSHLVNLIENGTEMRIPSEVNPPLNISLACDLTNRTGTDTNKRIQHHIFVDAIIVRGCQLDNTRLEPFPN